MSQDTNEERRHSLVLDLLDGKLRDLLNLREIKKRRGGKDDNVAVEFSLCSLLCRASASASAIQILQVL